VIEIKKVIRKMALPEHRGIQTTPSIFRFFIMEVGDMIIIAKQKQIRNAI
jgi:hypothetical protein